MSRKNEVICDVCGEPIPYSERRYILKPGLYLIFSEGSSHLCKKDICKYCFKEFRNYIQSKKEGQKSAT